MSADIFFDSSVLLYTLSRKDPRSRVALRLLEEGGMISVQVLNEFANVASKKLKLDWPRIKEILDEIRGLLEPPLALSVELHEQALVIAHRYKYSIYDSLMIAAALEAGCSTLYSEDMQHGQKFGSLTIANPFLTR